MIGTFIGWYLTLQFFAVAGLPLAFVWLRRLSSRGYAAAKALGLLLTGALFWWGGITHLWPNSTSAVVVAAGAVFAVGLWAMRGHWDAVRPWWREHRAFVFTTEALFLGALALWTVVRASQPQLETAGGEKWMEIAFLNAVLRAPSLPPHDPWLSGYAISYYYLGYLLLGMITRVAAVPSTIAFNLGSAAWFALAATGAYGLVYDLLERRDAARPLLAPLMLLLAGNAGGLLEVLHARGVLSPGFWQWLDIRNLNTPPQPPFSLKPTRFFWWWQSSRVLTDYAPWGDRIEIIDEFPAFSFTLGDMHPHVLALPFVLLAIALALNLYRREREGAGGDHPWWRRAAKLSGYALVLGALGFLNTWDFPIYWALTVGGMVLARYARASVGADARKPWARFFDTLLAAMPEAIALGVLSVAFYFPFWFALRSQAGGVLPNLFNATRWPQFVVMFAPLLVPVLGVVIGIAARAGVKGWAAVLWGVGLMVGIALLGVVVGAGAAYPYLASVWRGEPIQGLSISPDVVISAIKLRWTQSWVGLFLSMAVSAIVLAFLQQRDRLMDATDGTETSSGKSVPSVVVFPALMVLFGLLLTLAPEYVYLKDVFMARMNTIFKFYFQAWVLWSLAGAWQLARWLKPSSALSRRGLTSALAAFSGVLIVVGLVYTVLAVPARAEEHGAPWTLDGAAWLETAKPGDYAAIRWLNANVEGAPVIVEAPGDQHRAYVYEGRVSALTGLPTLLGWGGHQLQWRGNYDEPQQRERDIETLFTTFDRDAARAILARYDVAYIYVGPVERERYPAEGLAKFAEMFPAVYANDAVTIYAAGR